MCRLTEQSSVDAEASIVWREMMYYMYCLTEQSSVDAEASIV